MTYRANSRGLSASIDVCNSILSELDCQFLIDLFLAGEAQSVQNVRPGKDPVRGHFLGSAALICQDHKEERHPQQEEEGTAHPGRLDQGGEGGQGGAPEGGSEGQFPVKGRDIQFL